MKTKIIYISGSEVFEMADVRAAFEEVRNTLGLDKNTILFGVPVDADNALAEQSIQKQPEPNVYNTISESEITAPPETQTTSAIESDKETEKTIKKSKSSRATKKQDDVIAMHGAHVTNESEPVSEQDKIIPILSVLGNKNANAEMDTVAEPVETHEDTISEPQITDVPSIETDTQESTITETETVVISDINIESELVAPSIDEHENVDKITIGDMINDDAPVAQTEKTLEQLLESMTPLREDHVSDIADDTVVDKSDDEFISPQDVDNLMDSDDTDATLAQLASEFAQTEDKISVQKKTEPQGKIGRLKNILPFKKIKRDDNGLMGDLFGWAGIAANDDDFSMPGFFTGAKKQGM